MKKDKEVNIVKEVKIVKDMKIVKGVKIVREVKIVKVVKSSDSLWRFACGDVFKRYSKALKGPLGLAFFGILSDLWNFIGFYWTLVDSLWFSDMRGSQNKGIFPSIFQNVSFPILEVILRNTLLKVWNPRATFISNDIVCGILSS